MSKTKEINDTLQIHIGVVGAGLMGISIITCLLASGHPVTVVEIDNARKGNARKSIKAHLNEMYEKGLFTGSVDRTLDVLNISSRMKSIENCGLVIEAIFENITEKQKVIQEIEAEVSTKAVIGTNTSAIPISILQEKAKYPERVIGIHWAEPAHITRFMEIICGDKTDIKNGEKVKSWAEHWGKEPSLIKKDIRGFVTNRLLYAMLREAFYLVESGVCEIEDIDRSVRNDMGWWTAFAGPFRFMDLTGIQAYGAVMEDLNKELYNGTEVPQLMKEKLAEHAQGISNQKGFYKYNAETAKIWEKMFNQFTYEIRQVALQYPQNI